MDEVNHVDMKIFDKNLANIPPCQPAETTFAPAENTFFLKLHTTHGFIWDHEIMGYMDVEEGTIAPIGWMADEDNND